MKLKHLYAIMAILFYVVIANTVFLLRHPIAGQGAQIVYLPQILTFQRVPELQVEENEQ